LIVSPFFPRKFGRILIYYISAQLESKKSVNTESMGSTNFGSEDSSSESKPKGAVRSKSINGAAHTSSSSSDTLFKNNPDAVTEKMRAFNDITVDHNVEKAMRVLKRKLIREGLFKELKLRKNYEKPSEKKLRKSKESLKRARKEEAREKKFMNGLV